jgi:hypothetical protein
VPDRRLFHGPFQRAAGMIRAVDPDDDSTHCLLPLPTAARRRRFVLTINVRKSQQKRPSR